MDRRGTDEIRRKIGEWERLRGECADDGGPGVASFIDREVDRLRFELSARDRPRPQGRRAGDTAGT